MALSLRGVNRIFRILGLDQPSEERAQDIIDSGRSATEVRDDLLEWGQGQGEDTYREMVRNLVESRVGDANTAEGQIDSIVDQIVSGEATIEEKYADIDKYILKGEPSSGSDGSPPDARTDADPGTLPGVLAGGETIRVGSGDSARFYQVYEFPPGSGQFVSYQYNDRAQVQAIQGEDFDVTSRSENWFNQRVLAEADVEEVTGLEGTWQGLSNEIMRDAATAAGVRDPSLVGEMFSDPEIQNIMAQAVIGDWTPEQILAEQRKTNFWKNELYPGIDKFYNKTTNPERAWAEYRAKVSPALKQLGYEPGQDGTYRDLVGNMLNQEIDGDIFLQQVPTFIRATQNAEFAGVLNQWAQKELGREVEFNDWFDLMAGESAPELEQVAERAQLAYRAQEASAGVGTQQIERLAERTDLSDREAQQLFAQYTRDVLALGDIGFQRGNLTRDEVLSAYAGVAPETGRSIEEVKLQVAKLAKEEGLFDDEKASFYVGFDQSGRPVRPGLAALTPEGA